MNVTITTTQLPDPQVVKFIIAVEIDGRLKETITVPASKVVRYRNQTCSRWSSTRGVMGVTANAIPWPKEAVCKS